ncbi:serine/threonine protein kinase [Corynebacterium diphtheriae]|uniref:serine/threonine protein kinase n=1 Tax=Corynebacterium diphtheriae TaxID=1717 RepID=UPI0009287AE5|nr:serine/threonine protein kinase [Corynebacterium diphtheriae]OJH97135.1 serine/threonine protein kinase [Corynebacterium diphtheriae]CAB0665102.1 serine/threonine protein kinase [Corynebacterium diphtheriae]
MNETEAVPFDPFADDTDDDLDELLSDLDQLRMDVGQRSREEAISTFRSRRGANRTSRTVANGMVTLPFIPVRPVSEVLKSEEYIASVGDEPALKPGDVLAGQYEVAGVIAHGGMGWIYLAHDRNVSGRMVVLKGLRDKAKPQDYGAAVAEKEFLADITHPGIVKSYNFIDDLIVMEYVEGPALRGPMAIDLAIGYILEILPALDYLHSRGVVYNDLKPDNIIISEDQVKLIDLGAVSGIGAFGYIYGTKGYQAPEVASDGPSIASDIYTIGRTLADLTIDLNDGAGGKKDLPTADEEPLFAQNLSFYRLVRRCTRSDPAKRFSSVRELETQLYGVLREYLAVHKSQQFPAQHSLYSPQRSTFGTKHMVFRTDQLIDGIERNVRITSEEINAALPVPLLDRQDPGAILISGSSYTEPSEALQTMREAMTQEKFSGSVEIPLGIVRALLDLGFTDEAASWLEDLVPRLGNEWRHQWYSGVTSLLLDDYLTAQQHFNEVYNILPGESAPKLARAAVCEMLLQEKGLESTALLDPAVTVAAADIKGEGMSNIWRELTSDPATLRFKAIYLYALVWRTNPTTVSSAFGLARQLAAENQIDLAVSTLDRVPQNSTHRRMAELTAILHLLGDLSEARLRRAARRLEAIPTNEPRFLQIQIAIMNAALQWLRTGGKATNNPIFEYPFTQRGLRNGLSATLRQLARSAPSSHRYALVDVANQVRPMTWF